MIDLNLDEIALAIAPRDAGTGNVTVKEAASFRGWLGDGEGAGQGDHAPYRLYLSPWGERWLEFTKRQVLHRQRNNDGSSFVWIGAAESIKLCRQATALALAATTADDADDPTIAARVPKY